ncbi:MAG TPA: SAF domain-containing protein [Jatrophihabitans sp.]|nr:SAF domain-containing protein [Jatrophihabitans sp.]
MAVVPPSPRPRRIATPSWLDLRLVLGVLLVLVSVLVGAKVVAGASHTYPVVAVTRDLSAGTIVTAADVRLNQVQLPNRGRGVYLTATHDAVGRKLSRPVRRGELLAAGAVTTVGSQTTLTVPLAAGAAPQLRTGQRIKVWVSTSTCSSLVLLRDVTVQSVHSDDAGSFGASSGGQNVVISVDPAVADRVIAALALDGAKLRAGVLVGASPAPTDAPGSGNASPLPDLAACASPSR